MSNEYDAKDYACKNEDDEHLIRVVVDTCSRTFRLFSNEGGEKVVECDNYEEFMNVLELVRAVVDEDILAYSEARVATS
tara:strand:+ start:565 stop:801 length:237 start_codon:yes stop_codon:yes gene_type:complete